MGAAVARTLPTWLQRVIGAGGGGEDNNATPAAPQQQQQPASPSAVSYTPQVHKAGAGAAAGLGSSGVNASPMFSSARFIYENVGSVYLMKGERVNCGTLDQGCVSTTWALPPCCGIVQHLPPGGNSHLLVVAYATYPHGWPRVLFGNTARSHCLL